LIERRSNQLSTALACLLALLLAPLPSPAQERAEEVFGQAARYTVKIETDVPLPVYSEDEAGNFTGAGFVVDAERGWIVTNAHVVSRSPAKLRVRLRGGPWLPARRVYVDPYLDVAVLAPHQPAKLAGVAAARLACDGMPPVGHPVGAFGHPWNLDFTGTRGIVAGASDRFEVGALLTDAPINDGNSGGPLISLVDGRVVGVNTSALDAKSVQNLNFAIASHYVCRILDLLRAGRDPSPLARSLVLFADSQQTGEVKIARNFMPPGSLPLQTGDVIDAVVGEPGPITQESELIHALRGHLDDVTLTIRRDGQSLTLRGRLPAIDPILRRRTIYASGVVFGQARNFDPSEINYSRIATCHIEDGSLGKSAGFAGCDAVESVDGVAVDNLEDLYRRLDAARAAGRPVQVTVKRIAGLKGRSYFEYHELSLPVEALEWLDLQDDKPR
jgi:S1-C subfamily serine protease